VLWSEARPRFAGTYVKFDGIVLEPKPVQQPVPIWVGGEGMNAIRRAARVAEAWYPIGSNNQHLLDTLPRLESGIARLRQAATETGRDVGVSFRVKRYGSAVPTKANNGERRLFSGSEADLIADLRALKKLGVGDIDIDFGRPTADAVLAEMKRFRAAVIEKI
jgi:alkanesulfonate monooxygenase SsuD/methylene tetrahydromethanopterin reductase-like flavin-dependent oxidoreductase (luciferase family)